MVASPLAATVVTAILRCDFCAAKSGTFSTPLRDHCSVSPVQRSTAEQARSSFGGLPNFFVRVCSLVRSPPPIPKQWRKKKTNKHKEFWRDTPWCASRLSRGHVPSVPWCVPSVPGTFCPSSIDLHINQAQMSQVSPGRPECVCGTPPGIRPPNSFMWFFFIGFFLSINNKQPSRTKKTTESIFCTRTKFATAVAKRHGECWKMLVFQRKKVAKRYGECWKKLGLR